MRCCKRRSSIVFRLILSSNRTRFFNVRRRAIRIPLLADALVIRDHREIDRPFIPPGFPVRRAIEMADEITMHATVVAAELLDQHVEVDERRPAARPDASN